MPGFNPLNPNYTNPILPTAADLGKSSLPTHVAFTGLEAAIDDFQASVGADKDVELLVQCGPTTVSVEQYGYRGSQLLVFTGTCKAGPVRVVQHLNQANLLLLAVDKKNPEDPPRRIGFLAEPTSAES